MLHFILSKIVGQGKDYQPQPNDYRTITETLIILDIIKSESSNYFIKHLTKKIRSRVFASSRTASNAKRTNLA